MKKFLLMLFFVVTFFGLDYTGASAVSNDTVKVGLRYGSSALSVANLENAEGRGYSFGYYDVDRSFVALGSTSETQISMKGRSGYCVQLDESFSDFEDAAQLAETYDQAYPAYISGAFVVRLGTFETQDEAERFAGSGSVLSASRTSVLVVATKTGTPLFEYDCKGASSLGIEPNGNGGTAVTWFKGYRYRGGFEYDRITGGSINVLNVVSLEDYVKGVVPYEMSGSWPLAALEAQAVCARTYVCGQTKHLSAYGFDVCATTDCQVYNGISLATEQSDTAVENTAGECIYYDGSIIGVNAVYSSSDGGATEDAENVWGTAFGYLLGKEDPYEATISIPNYTYTVSYTPAQLTWVLQNSGYSIGTIQNVYVSEYTPQGNVYKVTFVDTNGKSMTVKGEKARTVFYSSTYGKSVKSMRFQITGGAAPSTAYYVNSASNPLDSLSGASVISGSGTVSQLRGAAPYVITASGTAALADLGIAASGSDEDVFTITGTGSGHNVGMSQYGANAMAKQGYDYQDILNFYYSNVTIG